MRGRKSNRSSAEQPWSGSRRGFLRGGGFVVLAAGCALAAAPAVLASWALTAPAAQAAAAPAAKSGVAKASPFTVAYPGSVSFNHIATYVAWDRLNAKGFQISTKQYSNIGLATNAVVSGESPIGWIAAGGAMNAVKRGSGVQAFFHGQKNVFIVVARKSINSLRELHGRPFGDNVPGQLLDGLRVALERKHAFSPQLIRINESEQRAQGLLTGRLDAASLQPDDFLGIESRRPGEFKILVRYSEMFPTVGGTFLWVRSDFAERHPEAMAEITETLILTYRQAKDDPTRFLADARKKLPNYSDEMLKAYLRAYVEPGYWDVNGGMSRQLGQDTAAFYAEFGVVKDPPPVDRWMNVKLVEAALAKLGRR